MRVVIYEPEPRMCGSMSWVFAIREGFARLGHEVSVVASTKTGKSRVMWGEARHGARWWSKKPDVVVRNDEVLATLDAADLVVLPELRNPPQDGEAKRKEELPLYVRCMLETKTPWTTAMIGNFYTPRIAPFADVILESPSLGTPVTTSAAQADPSVNPALAKKAWWVVNLAYASVIDVDAPIVGGDTVGMMGRFIGNKGSILGCLVGATLPDDLTYEAWGAASIGAAGNVTYDVFVGLRDQMGAMAVRYRPDHDTGDGNKIRPYRWDARVPGQALVRYLGNYTDPIATAQRLAVHVGLSGLKYTNSVLEYSTFEAMDAGSLCVVPAHMTTGDYRVAVPEGFVDPPGGIKTTLGPKNDALREAVRSAIVTSVDFVRSDPRGAHEVVRHNRAAVRRVHDPALVAGQLIEAAHARQ